ncbi:BRCA1-associated RING domain protein 1-like [Ylistrum balloti]|uniref:BRCA1-associated RING domain protein 1-like n=1 Tax=Ylistrum balloti TaxID=509963 RepID=UPI0029058140|nr:BRCA1-associated RING domain protein 1-like [Ylistrum balloti]
MAVQYLHTRTALSELQALLKCSKCDKIASSPCTLGSCEHIYCRDCCEDVLGKSCPVCLIPTDVRDAHVNRQLFTLVTLCQKLDEALTSTPDSQTTSFTPVSTSNHKFSTSDTRTKSNLTRQQQRRSTPTKDEKVSSTKCGPSNSPGPKLGNLQSTPGKGDKAPTTKCGPSNSPGPKLGKLRSTTGSKGGKSNPLSSPASKLGNRDSVPVNQSTMTQHFGNRDDEEMTEDRETHDTEGKVNDEPVGSTITDDVHILQDTSRPVRSRTKLSKSPGHSNVLGQESPVSTVKTFNDKTSSTPTSTRKLKTQCKKSFPVNKTRNLRVRLLEKSDTNSNQNSENVLPKKGKNKRHSIGVVRAASTSVSATASGNKKSRRSLSPTALTKRSTAVIPLSPATRSRGKLTPVNTSLTGSGKKVVNEIERRNAKGETFLQVACIKGDFVRVEELLNGGATPNTRDNAGWTPLHEACHHGYVDIARLLLDHGALIDVPGTENATPLHDAVSHGRVECVALLVSRGASLTARNLYGYTPVDCARSEEVKTALKTAVQSVSVGRETVDVLEYQLPCLLGTALNREQKIALQRCAAVLNAKVVQDFCPEVTHVITSSNQDGQCPRTIKYLMAVLQGKWILNMDWINTCLEYGSRVSEEAFEVPGTSTNPNTLAPQRARTNSRLQLPGLFDGCQFYFHGKFEYPTPEKSELLDLVKAGGGLVLKREPKVGSLDESTLTVPYHADPDSDGAQCCVFVLHDNSVSFSKINTRRMCSLPVSWLMDCISSFSLISYCNRY